MQSKSTESIVAGRDVSVVVASPPSEPDGLFRLGGLARSSRSGTSRAVHWTGAAGPDESDSDHDPGETRIAVDSRVRAGSERLVTTSLDPTLHGIDARVAETDDWEAFQMANMSYACSVVDTTPPGSSVWFHDAPLMLAPGLVRSVRPDLAIAFSFHTPFDDRAMLGFAGASEIASSLGGCDIVGVQTAIDADRLDAFLSVTNSTIATGPMPTIVVTPTSIDPDLTRSTAHRSSAFASGLDERIGPRRLIAAIDPLDVTSGIADKLIAYDLAFDRGAITPEHVHVVQMIEPQRHGADTSGVRREIERLRDAINDRWTRADATPVVEIDFDVTDRSRALAVLARADVAVVTSGHDGMGLVAKEFAAATGSRHGVLVVSNRIGAAAELGASSVVVEGSDPTSVSDGIARALALDTRTRRRLAESRSAVVERWTADDWADTIIDLLAASTPPGIRPAAALVGNIAR